VWAAILLRGQTYRVKDSRRRLTGRKEWSNPKIFFQFDFGSQEAHFKRKVSEETHRRANHRP